LNISRSKASHWMQIGEIPTVRIGNRRRLPAGIPGTVDRDCVEGGTTPIIEGTED
jgi:hypothetical protein